MCSICRRSQPRCVPKPAVAKGEIVVDSISARGGPALRTSRRGSTADDRSEPLVEISKSRGSTAWARSRWRQVGAWRSSRAENLDRTEQSTSSARRGHRVGRASRAARRSVPLPGPSVEKFRARGRAWHVLGRAAPSLAGASSTCPSPSRSSSRRAGVSLAQPPLPNRQARSAGCRAGSIRDAQSPSRSVLQRNEESLQELWYLANACGVRAQRGWGACQVVRRMKCVCRLPRPRAPTLASACERCGVASTGHSGRCPVSLELARAFLAS